MLRSQTTYLLSLPLEVRNIIWSFLLISDKPLWPNVSALFRTVESNEQSEIPFVDLAHERTLAIARTCTKLFNETITIYFGSNRFMFGGTWEMYAFLYMIGAERQLCIKYISFAYHGSQRRQAFELLSKCKRLRQLDVMIFNETMKGARKPQDDLFKAAGMGAFRAIRGLASCKVTVREIVAIQNGTWKDMQWVFRDLNNEKRFFDEENIKKVERLLGDDVRKEENTAGMQLKEVWIDRKAIEDKKLEKLRAQKRRELKDFKKKEPKRLGRDEQQ